MGYEGEPKQILAVGRFWVGFGSSKIAGKVCETFMDGETCWDSRGENWRGFEPIGGAGLRP